MPLERVDDADDPRLAPYRDLPARDAGRHDGCFVAETREVVRQLLAGRRFTVRSVLLTEPALDALRGPLAAHPELPAYLAPLALLKRVVGFDFHRGCLALAERGADPGLTELLAHAPRRLVALEEVRNPDNVGGALRAARALGADGVLLSAGCCDPLYRKVVRVSMGAALLLPWARVADWDAALRALRAHGFGLLGLMPGAPTDVAALAGGAWLPERIALVAGTEGAGLRPSTLAAVDHRVRVPMAAGVDSLNVVAACAVALDRLGWARVIGQP
jgi:tRNA G18 (ribose-2'-O)-methylase SpoU